MRLTAGAKGIFINLIITTIYQVLIWLWGITGLIIYANGTAIVFTIYLVAWYIFICKINNQHAKVTGYIMAICCGGIKYIGDNLVVCSTLEQYEMIKSSDLLKFVLQYDRIRELLIWESALQQLIETFMLVIFFAGCCAIYRLKIHNVNRKYVITFCVALALYILIVVLEYMVSGNGFFLDFSDPIADVNIFFSYVEGLILWLIWDDLFKNESAIFEEN